MTFSSSEPYLSLSATKNSTATDLAWGAEVSGDLSVWSPATITLDTLTQFQAMDTIPVSGAAKRFIRVKISKPQAMVEP
jgi:hypothetical protein